jgi:hypothetical protein
MRNRPRLFVLRVPRVAGLLTAAMLVAAICPAARAQEIVSNRAVGGIAIDREGVLENARTDDSGTLGKFRKEALRPIAAELSKLTPLRKVSLRRLEAAIAKHAKAGQPLPDEIKYLAGLQEVRYVFVDPENKDVILAGPGEGWTVDKRGFVVGLTTGRPVILLDDLLVALRTAVQAAEGNISCSIDPTAEGLARLRAHVAGLRTIGDRRSTAVSIEDALGPQRITVEGVPATSHFARVLVAADYRMKRLAMDFEPSPVRGLSSFMEMVGAGPQGINNWLPRWWLEPSYEAVLRDEAGLAWELRGASVKALTEDDFLAASGQVQRGGKTNPVAQRWADTMTAKFPELAVADPIFGQLRNCMDLAVVSTLIVKERLAEKAGWRSSLLTDSASPLAVERFPAPKQVASKASLAKKGRNWVIAVSGGVMIPVKAILEKARVEAELKAQRIESAVGKHDDWWWN